MSVPAAFIAVVMIWSTTPLAVKWSGQGPGFLFGALGRMTLAAVLCIALLLALRMSLPWHKQARRTYAAAAIAVYGAMLCVYWAAQHVPSGLIAVLFGLTPLMTTLLERWLIRAHALSAAKLAGAALGVLGLALIFQAGTDLGPRSTEGIAVLVLAVFVNALSMVLVKRQNAALSPLAVTTGALLYAAPLFWLTWLIVDGQPPAVLPAPALWSIVYLASIASVVGFTLFYYLLKHTPASAVALLTLVSPVLALLLGRIVDHEPVTAHVWYGSALVLAGLALHQWAPADSSSAIEKSDAS